MAMCVLEYASRIVYLNEVSGKRGHFMLSEVRDVFLPPYDKRANAAPVDGSSVWTLERSIPPRFQVYYRKLGALREITGTKLSWESPDGEVGSVNFRRSGVTGQAHYLLITERAKTLRDLVLQHPEILW